MTEKKVTYKRVPVFGFFVAIPSAWKMTQDAADNRYRARSRDGEIIMSLTCRHFNDIPKNSGKFILAALKTIIGTLVKSGGIKKIIAMTGDEHVGYAALAGETDIQYLYCAGATVNESFRMVQMIFTLSTADENSDRSDIEKMMMHIARSAAGDSNAHEDPDALVLQGFKYLHRNTAAANKKAIELFDQAMSIPGCRTSAYSGKASALSNLGRNAEAIPLYEKFLSKEIDNRKENNIEALNNLGLCYFEVGDPDKGIRCLNRLLKIDPDNIDALINLAGGWKDKGNYRKALSYVQRSVEIQPSGDGYYNVACYFSLLGKYDDALAALGTAISEYGSQWRNLARRDEDFIPMRSHPGFKSLMKGT